MVENLTKREPILIRILHEPDRMYKTEWEARLYWHDYFIGAKGKDPMKCLEALLKDTKRYLMEQSPILYQMFLDGYCDNEPEEHTVKYI